MSTPTLTSLKTLSLAKRIYADVPHILTLKRSTRARRNRTKEDVKEVKEVEEEEDEGDEEEEQRGK